MGMDHQAWREHGGGEGREVRTGVRELEQDPWVLVSSHQWKGIKIPAMLDGGEARR